MRELRQDWRDIFLGFRIALDAKKIILGAAGLVLSLAWIVGLTVILHYRPLALTDTSHDAVIEAVFRLPVAPGALKAVFNAPTSVPAWKTAFFSTTPGCFVTLLGDVFKDGFQFWECVGLLFYLIGLLAIWSLIGGGITRIAAVELAKDERIELGEATNYSASKFWSYFWSPLVPILGVIFFAFWVWLFALPGRIPWHVGEIWILLCSLGLPLALLAGFLIVLIVIGGVTGLILMFPTISTEGTDAFDAISRAYSYVYSKPWRYIWYCLVALAYGIAVVGFVMVFACYMTSWTLATAQLGAGEAAFGGIRTFALQTLLGNKEVVQPEGIQHASGAIVFLWVFIVAALAYGFAVSYACTASTIIYFLMRKAVDGTEMTEVYVEEEEEEALPTHEPQEEEAKPEPKEEPESESAGEEAAEEETEDSGEEDEKKK